MLTQERTNQSYFTSSTHCEPQTAAVHQAIQPSSHPAIDGCSVLLSRRLSSAGARKTLNESDKLFRWTTMSGFWLRGTTVFLFPARHMSWCSSCNERYLGELRVLLKGQRCAAPCFAWRRELRTVHNMRQLIKSEILKKDRSGIPHSRLNKAAQCKQ